MLELQFPNIIHKDMYNSVLSELRESNLVLAHPDRLFSYEYGDDSFQKMLEKVRIDLEGKMVGRVPATSFFLVDVKQNTILGGLNLRHHIDHEFLSFRGGHIGYGIIPSERKKGYGIKILELGLAEAKKLGLEKVLLTCKIENVASSKVIEENGGIFEKEALDEKTGEMFKRYWINV